MLWESLLQNRRDWQDSKVGEGKPKLILLIVFDFRGEYTITLDRTDRSMTIGLFELKTF